jgi:4-amino-4-deoxy-L-arabinose transferase-like glycosyltransferase
VPGYADGSLLAAVRLPRNGLVHDMFAIATLRNPARIPAHSLGKGGRLVVVCVALLVGFGFLGSRGIWDPDEGRYTNVALNMLDSGDWLDPRRNDDVDHWTKPPLTYWAIAASTELFGRNPWAARLPVAISYLLSVALTWQLARRLAPGAEAVAALAFATMLLPALASQLITTDVLLAAFEALAMWAYVEGRFGAHERRFRWWIAMWVAFGLAFLTKGPPALLPLAAILVLEWLAPSQVTRRSQLFAAVIAFLAVAVPWYVAVSVRHPGLFRYFLGSEVVGRVASDQFGRNGEWYGWAVVYLPTLLVGTLPWTASVARWLYTLPSKARRWQAPAERVSDSAELLLTIWLLVPLVVFCLARSRLPLYLLPLFLPLAILIARQRQSERRTPPPLRWIIATVASLTILRVAMIFWPTPENAEAWAAEIRKRSTGPVTDVVFINDEARYGLKLYLAAEVERVSIAAVTEAGFNRPFDESLAQELAEAEPGVVFVVQEKDWLAMERSIGALGYRLVRLGEPYRERIFFAVAGH